MSQQTQTQPTAQYPTMDGGFVSAGDTIYVVNVYTHAIKSMIVGERVMQRADMIPLAKQVWPVEQRYAFVSHAQAVTHAEFLCDRTIDRAMKDIARARRHQAKLRGLRIAAQRRVSPALPPARAVVAADAAGRAT